VLDALTKPSQKPSSFVEVDDADLAKAAAYAVMDYLQLCMEIIRICP
jgi:hypothetical protein